MRRQTWSIPRCQLSGPRSSGSGRGDPGGHGHCRTVFDEDARLSQPGELSGVSVAGRGIEGVGGFGGAGQLPAPEQQPVRRMASPRMHLSTRFGFCRAAAAVLSQTLSRQLTG